MRELFIYYRAKAGDAPALSAAVLAAQTQLASTRPGLQARLLRRPEPSDEQHTWMETYAFSPNGSPDGIDDALQREIESLLGAAVAPFLVGPRHTESFVPCAW